jgi:hypothetical protein
MIEKKHLNVFNFSRLAMIIRKVKLSIKNFLEMKRLIFICKAMKLYLKDMEMKNMSYMNLLKNKQKNLIKNNMKNNNNKRKLIENELKKKRNFQKNNLKKKKKKGMKEKKDL